MITPIYATGNLGGKPRVINGQKSNFLAFSIAVKGEDNMWIDCTMSFKGNQPPKILDFLDTGKTVGVYGMPHAKLIPAKDDYPARAQLSIYVDRIELLSGKDREIKGSQEQPNEQEKEQ